MKVNGRVTVTPQSTHDSPRLVTSREVALSEKNGAHVCADAVVYRHVTVGHTNGRRSVWAELSAQYQLPTSIARAKGFYNQRAQHDKHATIRNKEQTRDTDTNIMTLRMPY